jgi:phospholipid/cholesterol/gamma-HCH transport system permease protein
MAGFAWQAIRQAHHGLGFLPEVIRQAGIIATGSVPVIMLITFFAGGSCGVELSVITRQVGAETLAPGSMWVCSSREVVPFVFGYILAAKVGCGVVAELGAMRVREEVEALDVIGVRSVAYLVTTRLLAASLILPILFVLAEASGLAGAYLQSEVRFHDVSPGTWQVDFFAWQDTLDVLKIFAKGALMSAFVMVVSLYYGYTVRGGPVEVGMATARSMGVNIVGVTFINVACTFIFWGTSYRTLIA